MITILKWLVLIILFIYFCIRSDNLVNPEENEKLRKWLKY